MVEILKFPQYENDSYLIRLSAFFLSDALIKKMLKDDYIYLKYEKFKNKDISTQGFEKFSNRPSLSNISSLDDVSGSIYTYKVGVENNKSYEHILNDIKYRFIKHPNTRRMMVRIANDFSEYDQSVEYAKDVSCLNLIHYLKNEAKLVFRASDIQNELIADIITIYDFFLKPIYNVPINIEIFASTAQNINTLKSVRKEIESLYDE